MDTRQLGKQGPQVGALALGCMGMSGMYGATDQTESEQTIHAALDAGVTLIDTGDFYGMGHNELLVGRALKGRRDQVVLSVKFGALRDPRGGWTGFDGRPAAVKNFLAYSLQRLGVDYVDIYRPARLDPKVPVEDTVGAIADMIKTGYVRHVGLSETSAATLRKAHAVHPVVDVQLEYSLISRGIEEEILPACRELGVGVTAYGVLSRGLLGGSIPAKGDFRAFLPRFRNIEQNRRFVEALGAVAARLQVTPAQAAIAWVLAQDELIVPVLGARTRAQLKEGLDALSLHLSPEAQAELASLVEEHPIAGTRYDEGQMRMLDSEKKS